MKNAEYLVIRDLLINVGQILEGLDLEQFSRKNRSAQTLGPILDPTLYLASAENLEALEDLCQAGLRMKAAFSNLKTAVKP